MQTQGDPVLMRPNKLAWPVLAVAASLMIVGRPATAELVDAVVATVDNEVVLYSELMAEVGPELEKFRQSAISAEEYDRRAEQLVREALNQSIDARLLVREARKYPQLEVTDKELDLYVEDVRRLFDTPEEFVREVGGSVSDFRERRRQQLLAQRMSVNRMDAFESEVVVSEDEIASYYQEHIDEYSRPERVYVRQIFLRVRDEAERPQARAKLELLREEILAGTDFADLAKQHSEAPGAEDGGTIGWQQPGDLNEPLSSAAFALSTGGISEVLESPGGVHLLKVDEHETAGAATLADVRLEIEQILRRQTARKKYETWMIDIRKRSRVRIFI